MADREHLEILEQGPQAWSRWRAEHPDVVPDLIRADLRGTDLAGADLGGANMTEANLSGANLIMANLIRANLMRANLSAAVLAGADMNGAILSWANLARANLWLAGLARANLLKANLCSAYLVRADLSSALLAGATLRDASLRETGLANIDLSHTRDLNSCRHEGPSHVDYRTLERSCALPLRFLRGCRLPDRLIEHLPTILESATEFYNCFISYATADEPFAARLHADLQSEGIRCWCVPDARKTGAYGLDTVHEVLRIDARLILVISDASASADWIEVELSGALEEERRRGEFFLVPVRLDHVAFESPGLWGVTLDGQREIVDFPQWQDVRSYQEAFVRLLAGLRRSRPETSHVRAPSGQSVSRPD